MKILLIIAVIFFASCKNNSAEKKIYQDSANMYLDSINKYKPDAVLDDSSEQIRKARYDMYLIVYKYYTKKVDDLK